jgi:hypothetical protein
MKNEMGYSKKSGKKSAFAQSDTTKPAWQKPSFAIADVKELTQADPFIFDDGFAAGNFSAS